MSNCGALLGVCEEMTSIGGCVWLVMLEESGVQFREF